MTLTSVAAESPRAPSTPAQEHDAYEDVRVLLVAAVLGGAAVHAAVVREHFAHWPAAGLFFVLLAGAGLVVGTALLRRVDRVRLIAALALAVGPLMVWLGSRTVGLPFGPEAGEPEAVGLPDTASGLLALTSAGAALLLLRAAPRLRGAVSGPAVQLVGLGLASAVTAVGLTTAVVAEPEHVEHLEHAHAGQAGRGHSLGVEVREHLTRTQADAHL